MASTGPNEEREERALSRLDRVARIMDEAFRLPGTSLRFGLDPLVGLIPGAGDTAAGAVSAYVLWEAWRLGAPRSLLARMTVRILIDVIVGTVPLGGDLFDAAWKVNRRNVDDLRRFLHARRPPVADGEM